MIGEQLGAAVTELPAVRGLMVDALDALGHGEARAIEDNNVSGLHDYPLNCTENAKAFPVTLSLGSKV